MTPRSTPAIPGKTQRFSRLVVVLGLLMATSSWATNYAPWSYYRSVTVTPGAGVSAAVTNFPLLVRLTSADSTLFGQCRSDGFDVRFTTADGTTDLPFQRASFDKTSKSAEFWVLLPSVDATPAATAIRMYWGNGGAADAQNPGSTFSTASGYDFRAVWHMSAPAGANEPDATGSGHDLVPSASPSDTIGPVGAGRAKKFDGSTQYFTANNSGGTASTLNFPAGGPFTIAAWVNPLTLQTCKTILGKTFNNACNTATAIAGSYAWTFAGNAAAGDLRLWDENGSAGFERCHTQLSASTWVHLVWVRNGTGTALANTDVYVNGVEAGGTVASNTAATTRIDTLSFCIGKDASYAGNTSTFWNGLIQEVQITNSAWSPSRISLSYQTQLSASAPVTFGATQNNSGPWGPPTLSAPANNAVNQPTSPALTWAAVVGAVSYAVQVGTASDFATTVAAQSGLTATSLTVGPLSNNKAYYWRANANNGTQTSAWAATWSFTTILPTPALAAPTNGATGVQTALTLSWTTVSGASTYAWQLSMASSFATTVFGQTGVTGSWAAVNGLGNNQTYYWHVNATNPAGTSLWSSTWSFATVTVPPTAPALATPTNGQTGILPTSATLSWTPTLQANYALQVSTSSGFGSTVTAQSFIAAQTSVVLTGLAANKTYYWHMNASNSFGTSAWTNAWSFNTVVSGIAPGAARLLQTEFSVKHGVIGYSLDHGDAVEISLCDMLGRTIPVLRKWQNAGRYSVALASLNLANGRYTVRFKSGQFEKTAVVILSR